MELWDNRVDEISLARFRRHRLGIAPQAKLSEFWMIFFQHIMVCDYIEQHPGTSLWHYYKIVGLAEKLWPEKVHCAALFVDPIIEKERGDLPIGEIDARLRNLMWI